MPAFAKPTSLKAALKMALYGPAGSGKTFTALLLAEGLARQTGKRIAFCDTEYGTPFYGQEVSQRALHPKAFDFDVLHSRSITDVLAAIKGLDPGTHGVVVVDSLSHLWDACKAAYHGKLTRMGSIPFQAWSTIKKPYRELMTLLLSMPQHVILCGRQGAEYGEDDLSGELKNLGFKMRAEGETAYEPDLLIRLEFQRDPTRKTCIPVALVEKDRTGILAGQLIPWPTFEKVAQPLLGLLGSTQAPVPCEEEVSIQDAEALARQEKEREMASSKMAHEYCQRIAQADSALVLERLGRELTPQVKKQLIPSHLELIRKHYADRLAQLKVPSEQRLPVNSHGPGD